MLFIVLTWYMDHLSRRRTEEGETAGRGINERPGEKKSMLTGLQVEKKKLKEETCHEQHSNKEQQCMDQNNGSTT